MAISTNQKPAIYRNLYANTGPVNRVNSLASLVALRPHDVGAVVRSPEPRSFNTVTKDILKPTIIERPRCDNGAQCRLSWPAMPYLNFHPLEVVSCYRDSQIHVGEKFFDRCSRGAWCQGRWFDPRVGQFQDCEC